MLRYLLLATVAGGVGLLCAGCHSDDITRYRVPREERQARPEKQPNRLLGAIVPQGNSSWFVKVVGPEKLVEEQAAPFEQFVLSLRFPEKGDPPITWKALKEWRQGPARQGRIATFHIGPAEQPLELTVTTFGGSVLDNVNRWRKQMGLREVGADELAKVTRQLKLDGVVATMVAISGPGAGKMAGGDAAPPDHPPIGEADPAKARISYAAPKNWKELPPGGFRVAAFYVSEGEEKALVTVIPLAGQAGTLLSNVNRWREELGLPKVDAEQLKKDVRPLEVAGLPGHYIDLRGPERTGRRLRTLAVSVPRQDQTWFFKMLGTADLVGRERAHFEEFVTSVRFADGGGK
jgi:hypothetical protein